jgi:hypothetical protein
MVIFLRDKNYKLKILILIRLDNTDTLFGH